MTENTNTPARQSATQRAILAELAKLGGALTTEDDLTFRGNEFVIPESMQVKDAIDFLKAYHKSSEEETEFSRTFQYRPWDGAHALQNAMKRVFGSAGIGKATYSFFGKNPPEMLTIKTGPNETTQVPWGAVTMPLIDGTIYLGQTRHREYGPLFVLSVTAPKKYRSHVEGLFRAVEDELRQNSIYRGHAIDGQDMAEFLDLAGVDPTKVVYSDEVMAQLDANVWSLVEHADVMREMNLPLKRSVLLEGPYGTGKTLAAFLTAQKAVENGWTFIYCRPGKDDLDTVLSTARLYQPSIVFYEDVDTIAQNGEADNVTRLLDMFDGINAKGTEIMAILTTNHADRIHKGMVRPGRLDAVIHIGALDRHGVETLIKSVVDNDVLGDVDYDKVYESMTDYLPAYVKEAVDRTLRYAVARTGGKPDVLTTEDFVRAADGLRDQLRLQEDATEGTKPDALNAAFTRIVEDVVHNTGMVPSDKNVNYEFVAVED
jgi:transitional endoplasmic reticulum ATPase